jgi:alpha-glucosidase
MNEPANFCPYPCLDPAGFTRDSGWINPPAPSPRKQRPSIPGFPPDFQPTASPSIEKRQINASKTGLPGRDLINPKYRINNFFGALSLQTADTDLIHSNGVAEYDTHNLYVSVSV